MDPEVVNIFYYHSLLHPDPPENTIIPTTSTVLDDSSVHTPSTLTIILGLRLKATIQTIENPTGAL
jgi:hypothetical protein